MALIDPEINREKFETILFRFNEELHRNPDANFTPYVRMFASAFRKMKKMCEKRVINTLFLNLYNPINAFELRKDLCKFAIPDQADTTKRQTLLPCIYDTLSLYVRYDFFDYVKWNKASIIAAHGPDSVACDLEKFAIILSKFREVCYNPHLDYLPYINMFEDEFRKLRRKCELNVVNTLILNLYGPNLHDLERYMTKVMVMRGTVFYRGLAAKPSERADLLRCLYGALAPFIKEDFSSIIAASDQWIHDRYIKDEQNEHFL